MTARVSFKSKTGAPVDGALAAPAGEAKAPAVVVLQEWWGLNEQIQGICDRFAAEGFVALAPDLYHGKLAKDADEASAMMKSLDWARALDDIEGAVEYLRAHDRSTGKVAVTGFCMGGALTLATACRVRGVAAAVPFYGIPGEADWAKVEAPVLFHVARHDDWVTVEAARKVEEAIRAGGGSIEVHVYDAHHAFFNERRPEVHSPEAAKLAWERTLAFLRAHTG